MIKVIAGCMKSGKSEEILRHYRRSKIAGMKVQIFKPDTDRRFGEGEVISRDDRQEECTVIPTSNSEYILSVLEPDTQLIIIDEVQFFKPKLKMISDNLAKEVYTIIDVIQEISDKNKKVIVSGLDMDSEKKPFGAMPYLMAIADEVKKLHAVCEVCHDSAMYSYANFDKTEQIELGDNRYTALCVNCYNLLTKENKKLINKNEGDGTIVKKIVNKEEQHD